jgi:hypothetical protein
MSLDVWTWLDRGAIVLAYAAVGTVAAVAYQWWGTVRRLERRARRDAELAAGKTAKPVALAVFFYGESIEADVRRYLSARYPGWSFPSLPAGADDPDPSPNRCPIVQLEHAGTLTPDVAEADLERLRAVERRLKDEGFTEVHLFLKSTVAFGCGVGCLFTNWGAVHVYHRDNRAGTYEYWFPLADVKRVGPPPALGNVLAAHVVQRLYPPAQPADAAALDPPREAAPRA